MPCSSIWRGRRGVDALAQKPAGQQLAARQNRRARQAGELTKTSSPCSGAFLAAQAQQPHGRPARARGAGPPRAFVDGNPERDALAQASLEAAAHTAGFQEVAFQLEPIAAALDYEQRPERRSVHPGGGHWRWVRPTSPWCAWGRSMQASVIARKTFWPPRGVHIGGTDFDYKLNVAEVQPLLGLGHHRPSGA